MDVTAFPPALLVNSLCTRLAWHRQFVRPQVHPVYLVVLQLKNKDTIMQQYGNAAEKAPEDGLLLGQTERYVEYDAAGRVVKGQDIKAHSRYEEDKHPNNHTSVWGSWWEAGQWGYACCHQTIKNSYCTGEAGKEAAEAQADQMQLNIERKAEDDKAREANGSNLEVQICCGPLQFGLAACQCEMARTSGCLAGTCIVCAQCLSNSVNGSIKAVFVFAS